MSLWVNHSRVIRGPGGGGQVTFRPGCLPAERTGNNNARKHLTALGRDLPLFLMLSERGSPGAGPGLKAGGGGTVGGGDYPGSGAYSVGSEVAGYRLEEQIGQGGMALVYRARDVQLGRNVALKLLSPALGSDATPLQTSASP